MFFYLNSKIKLIEGRNKKKNNFTIMNDKSNQHNIKKSPLINFSIKNQKLVESLKPTINMMNRTASDSLYKAKDITTKTPYKKIKLYNYSTKNKKHSNSTIGLITKKPYSYMKKYTKNDNNSQNSSNNNKYKNTFAENAKISFKIFKDLDRIQETLLEDFKAINNQNMKNENIQEKSNNNNKSEEKKINENKDILKNKKNHIINYFNKNNEKKYCTVPIKSRTTYNFYPISQSQKIISEPLSIKHPHTHKRLKSTDENKPKHITRYLERTKINGLPVTYPLYLSYNNKYHSISEKNRVDKILNKLICLKTHILKDPLNRIEIVKEFLLRNGFDNNKYFQEDSINNFLFYLKQPFSFSPECSLNDVINEAINCKYNKEQDDNNDMSIATFLDYLPKERRWNDLEEYNSKKKIKNNNSLGNEIIYNLLMEEIFKRRYINYDNFRNKTLPILIKDLEFELRQIKIDKMNKLDEYNNLISTRKLQTIKLLDNNKYVPNLCLISKGFKEKCKAVIDKKNKKIINNMNKQEHLKQINNRLYYDNIRKNNLIEFDRNDIQRKLKLTEFVVMERAKKKLQIQMAKNRFISFLDRIKNKEYNKSN